jgi:hypothetical protein
MPSPFPGMDPYLEDPAVWPDVHHELISAIRFLLNKVIRPRYVARVEERVYMVPEDDPAQEKWQIPDVSVETRPSHPTWSARKSGGLAIAEPIVIQENGPVREGRVEILEVGSRKVVTAIELLSPSNKVKGAKGRKSFLRKRKEIIHSNAHWVEIDLLREGLSHPAKSPGCDHQYQVFCAPVGHRAGKYWKMNLPEPLKVVGIPLLAPDPDAPLDLQAAVEMAFDRGSYDATIDYAKPPVPPLPPALARWANKLLKQKKLR